MRRGPSIEMRQGCHMTALLKSRACSSPCVPTLSWQTTVQVLFSLWVLFSLCTYVLFSLCSYVELSDYTPGLGFRLYPFSFAPKST